MAICHARGDSSRSRPREMMSETVSSCSSVRFAASLAPRLSCPGWVGPSAALQLSDVAYAGARRLSITMTIPAATSTVMVAAATNPISNPARIPTSPAVLAVVGDSPPGVGLDDGDQQGRTVGGDLDLHRTGVGLVHFRFTHDLRGRDVGRLDGAQLGKELLRGVGTQPLEPGIHGPVLGRGHPGRHPPF